MNRTGQNPNLTAFTSNIHVVCRPEWAKGGTPWKLISIIFKCRWKKAVICLVFMAPSWVMFLKLSKSVSFLHFFADVSNKSEAVIVVYVYAFESSRFTPLEKGIGYYAMSYSLEDISVWRWWISLSFADSAFFWYFIPQYLVNCYSDPYKTYYFLKEHDEVFEMNINKLL